MSTKDQARETADRIRREVEAEKNNEVEAVAKAKLQLAAIRENPELAALYKAHAKLGSENLGGSAPYLRIHTANSTANELPDGSYPKDGQYFYAPTKQAFDKITCHILTVSKGFKVWQEDKKTGDKKLQFNQIVGGIIIDKGEQKPFLWYINGLKCQPLWKFGKEANEFTRAGIPMFSIVVELSTEQVKSDYGMKWVPVFEIVKEDGQPQLVLDVETFNELMAGVAKLEESIASLISSKASEDEEKVVPTPIEGKNVEENDYSKSEDASFYNG